MIKAPPYVSIKVHLGYSVPKPDALYFPLAGFFVFLVSSTSVQSKFTKLKQGKFFVSVIRLGNGRVW